MTIRVAVEATREAAVSQLTDTGVEYDVLRDADVEATIHLIANAFSAADPPAVAMGLTAQDLAQMLGIIAPQAAKAGLTSIARLRSSGEVVGAMLSEDFAAPVTADVEDISQRFRPIFAMLGQLDVRYSPSRPASGEAVHLLMLAVGARFAGRGIAQGLVRSCLENASAKGYRRAVTEATGAASQHLFSKLGFQERLRITYQDFRYEGEAVFSSIADHGGTALMDRALP